MGLCHSSLEKSTGHEMGIGSSPAAPAAAASPRRPGSGRWKRMRDSRSGDENGELYQVPGRMFANGSSEMACLHTQQGKKGTNQDAMLVWENFSSRSDTVFCGIFDGHGPFGHMVAKKVRDALPFILSTQWKVPPDGEQGGTENGSESLGNDEAQGNESASMDDQWHESLPGEEKEKIPEMFLPLKQALLKACHLVDKELRVHPTIDCFCSGSTAVTLIKQGKNLVIGNVGDSRAVLATKDQDGSLVAVQLTVDLKPDLPRESARIQKCKGRVFALQDEPEVARVWLPNSDSPGLAMARAFGDFCLKDYGLISVPDISYRCLTERDVFIILATDGVWDVLSNKEAVDVVASAPSRATAARAVVDTAVRAWRLKYPTSKNDDCAVVCLFLDSSFVATEAAELDKAGQNCEALVESLVVTEFKDGTVETKSEKLASSLNQSNTIRCVDEIEPVIESKEERVGVKPRIESTRTLAECISVPDDDEGWSALEGLTRANSLLSLPRFLSGELRSASWRKWL